MEKSASIINIAKSLSIFHVKVDKIKRDAKNPFFKSKYATLSNILESIQVPLQESGLIFTQLPDGEGLTSILMHVETGEYMQATYTISPVPEYTKEKDSNGNVIFRSNSYISPQAIGSAITYAKRYALGAILGLNIDEDDDGNNASGKKESTPDLPWLNENTDVFKSACEKLKSGGTTIEKIKAAFRLSKSVETKLLSNIKKAS